ncbi:type III secretion system export apparatus subunit SctT [Achromobacter marplatensis]|uniref:type III secretion system export apparatus subunit SctT n=1 Tax=Achromobacter marplatensis TaxID=470868 RepID=UPI0039F6AC43
MIAGVTYEEAKILLGTLAMTQPRILALSMMLPIFNRSLLPGMLRYAVAAAMGLILVPALAVDYARWGGGTLDIILILTKEAFVGLVMGYIIALPFWIFEAAGFIIDNQRGASLGATLNPGTGNDSSPMGILFNQAFIVFFLTSGGFFLMMTMIVTSFQVWSIWNWWPTLHASSIPLFLDLLDKFLRMTLLYAAPAVIAMFLAEIGLALVSRFAPQLQVFFLAMPIKSALALLVLVLYTKVLFGFAWESVAEVSETLPFLQREWLPQ